jgi:hypothetical protein
VNPTGAVAVFRPRLLRVHGLGQLQRALKSTARPLTSLRHDSLWRRSRALAGNDEVALADKDAHLFGGRSLKVNHHEVGIRRLVEVQERSPPLPSGDGPGTVNQLVEQLVYLSVQVEKRGLQGT